MPKNVSCFTCEHHNFEGSWLENKTCVECVGKYAEKVSTRKNYKFNAKVAKKTHYLSA